MSERVAILGASDQPGRFANRAQRMLLEHGHQVVPVNPKLARVDGLPVVPRLEDIEGAVDTVTVYLRPALSEPLEQSLVALRPRRVIFNPGAESPKLTTRLREEGIEVEWACTLVLLRTGQFEPA